MGVASGGTIQAAADAIGPPLGTGSIIGGGIVVLLAATGTFLFLRFRGARTPERRLRRALAATDEVAVLTHPNPDPDALACALAVRELAETVGTAATIYYPGEIRREENLALIDEIGIEATQIRDASSLVDRDVVLVDHNQPRGFAGAGGVEAYAVIDHHPGDGEGSRFTDIRPDYGACASLVAEYLRDLGWGTDEGEQPAMSKSLATALVYGIRSDTGGFTRGCTTAEFDAAAYCSKRADPDAIERVASPPLSPETMDVRARAVLGRVQRGAFVCTHAGPVPSADAVAQAAEKLLRMQGVRAVVVAGTCDETLHLSGRAIEGSVDIGETLSAAIEGIPMADAGGHARMGGGQLSVDHMAGLGPGDGVSIERLFGSIFAVMASQDPEGAPDEPAEPVDPGAVGVSDSERDPGASAAEPGDEESTEEPVDQPEASGQD